MTKEDWEPSDGRIRRQLGKLKYEKLTSNVRDSIVPTSFHLGVLLAVQKGKNGYPAQEIIHRLAGLNYSDFKSSRYAILYGQAMSLMKISDQQKQGESIWPTNLYKNDLKMPGSAITLCEELALEEVRDDDRLWLNPPLSLRIQDSWAFLKRSITGEFNTQRIMSEIEESFSNQSQVIVLNSYVALKLSQQGMPSGW